MCNTWNRFEKSLEIVQGPSILKVRARHCRATVLYTLSQEAGVLLFYIKPMVRICYYFYMCDPINAVYNNMYPVESIHAGKWMPKDSYKSPKCWRDAQRVITQDFVRSYQLSQKLF